MRVRDGRGQEHDLGPGRASGRHFRPAPPQETDDWVSLTTVLGTTRVPKEVARLLNDVVVRMEAAGDIGPLNRWQVIEYLAAEWLAGQEAG